jgi:acetolactate synthase-1/2/3 large subunit
MNGAECLLTTLLANGVDLCLANPGTSEMQFVSALDRTPAMRGVLCLFEGVCSGAADGYARMTRRPAATLLHLGPGLGNAIANFHNARKARSPIVNIVGEHATQHLQCNAPLTADIEAIARPVSGYVRTVGHAVEIGPAAAEAVRAAYGPPGQVSTLIVPADCSWSDAAEAGPALAPPRPVMPRFENVREAARWARAGERTGFFLGGGALLAPALEFAARIAAATGARFFADRYAARLTRGRKALALPRVAYFPEQAEPLLAGLEHLILVETQPPVSFFAYPGRRSYLAPENCALHTLAAEHEDGTAALAALLDECAPHQAVSGARDQGLPELIDSGPLTLDAIGRALAVMLPEGGILSDEAVSSGEAVTRYLTAAAPHDQLPCTGGSIGQGLPVAVGAALACPDRKVIAIEADGSAMYTLQALWTMARERLDVVSIILANRRYRILEIELRRTGSSSMGRVSNDMMDLTRPEIDWVKISEGQGVPATRATTCKAFNRALRDAVQAHGPHLIEAIVPA